jgi:SAM-dependent methyltransferase
MGPASDESGRGGFTIQQAVRDMTKIERARRNIEDRIYREAVGLPPDSKWKSILAVFTEKGFAERVVRKRLKLPTPLNTTDRMVLEKAVFPRFNSDPAIRNVLFVGCDTYTAHYQREFFSNTNYTTIEPDRRRARFGAKKHVVAPLEEIGRHFGPCSFDLIICNGVFGWGLDTVQQCEAAFSQCHTCLADGGLMLLGWDDVPLRKPVPLEQIASLNRFQRYPFPAFGTWRYVTDTPFRHTYDFYRK